MTDQQTTDNARRSPFIAVLLPWLLIGQFLWKLLTTAHEYPMRAEQVMTMTFDLGMLVGLIALRSSMPKPLFWIALVAGVGLFALRLTSDAAGGPAISAIRCRRGERPRAIAAVSEKRVRRSVSSASPALPARCARHIRCSRRHIDGCPPASARAPGWTAPRESTGRGRRTAWCPHIPTVP